VSYTRRIQADHKIKTYDKIVVDHFNAGGRMIVCSDDAGFVKVVRYALEQLGIDYRSHMLEELDYDAALTSLTRQYEKTRGLIVIFLERKIGPKSFIKTLKVLKQFYAKRVRAIVTSDEIGREEIVLVYEVGADNVIIKPISANAVIEKIAFAIKPNNELSVLFDRAAECLRQGDLDTAERIAERIFEIKPSSLAGHILLGDVATRRENYDDAREHYQNAAKNERLFVKPLVRLAELCHKTGDLEGRLEYLSKLEKLSPLNFERKIEIGETYLELDDMEAANEHFQQATKVVKRVANEMVSDSLMRIAKKVADKDKDMALQYMDEAISVRGKELSRADLWMFNERGIVLRQQDKWQEAIENYNKALRIAPDDGGIYYNIGVAYAVGKQYRKAVQAFVKALDIDAFILRQSPAVPYNIGLGYMNLGKRQDSIAMFKQALEVDPDYQPARKMLAKLEGG
jgi:tetratricopeptide (TPR) repeat protein